MQQLNVKWWCALAGLICMAPQAALAWSLKPWDLEVGAHYGHVVSNGRQELGPNYDKSGATFHVAAVHRFPAFHGRFAHSGLGLVAKGGWASNSKGTEVMHSLIGPKFVLGGKYVAGYLNLGYSLSRHDIAAKTYSHHTFFFGLGLELLAWRRSHWLVGLSGGFDYSPAGNYDAKDASGYTEDGDHVFHAVFSVGPFVRRSF